MCACLQLLLFLASPHPTLAALYISQQRKITILFLLFVFSHDVASPLFNGKKKIKRKKVPNMVTVGLCTTSSMSQGFVPCIELKETYDYIHVNSCLLHHVPTTYPSDVSQLDCRIKGETVHLRP